MVRIAASSMFFHEYPLPDVFDFVAAAGLDGIEFWVETPHFWTRDLPVGELLACIASHRSLAPITVHAPILDLNPCSINPRVAALSLSDILQAVEIAAQADADVVTVHPGRRTAKRVPTAADYERFERLIQTLRDAARRTGVSISIENMEPQVNSLLHTPEDARDLLDREPWLKFTLDTAHALSRDLASAHAYIDLCFDRLVNIHLSSVRDGRKHLPVHGDPAAATILEDLASRGYAGHLTLEIEDLNFGYEATAEEKILLLAREREFIRHYMG
ncbi:MAG: sugar phosphate isomerase/epimerase family protein [Methanomicrobiales archaeon]|nr:sugar phosphate isomerase/epimerase family protein [Methanomicrobiales archaeon]MDI6875292.1 sugar phosphate isomerase/epimerase family protein [Methanomicrobiales archaeon]